MHASRDEGLAWFSGLASLLVSAYIGSFEASKLQSTDNLLNQGGESMTHIQLGNYGNDILLLKFITKQYMKRSEVELRYPVLYKRHAKQQVHRDLYLVLDAS